MDNAKEDDITDPDVWDDYIFDVINQERPGSSVIPYNLRKGGMSASDEIQFFLFALIEKHINSGGKNDNKFVPE